MKKNILGLYCLINVALVAATSCNNVKASGSDAAFEYREVYLPESTGKNAKLLGLNELDADWGIWGHNLPDVLPDEPSLSVYAKKNGTEPVKEQFCFSSNHLYQYIEDYIIDNYGEEETTRFAILPNDNSIVCTGPRCSSAGNTNTDASPAVIKLIRRLCERFPNHIFFTSYYLTTQTPPTEPLPKNAGVLISAMDYPRFQTPTDREAKFVELLKNWERSTDRVYVWDYISNYDDFFTPFPVIATTQRRLQTYRNAGVDGIFLNGSGTEYTSLGKLTAHVLAALTDNPDTDWRLLLHTLCDRFYPTAGETIYDFMIAQENFVAEQGKELPMYEGIHKALQTYLPRERFLQFYNDIDSLRACATGQEKEELDNLFGALSFTRLEIARHDGNLDGIEPALAALAAMSERGNVAYSEAYWSVADYVKDYKFILEHAAATGDSNILKGKEIKPLTKLDEDYSSTYIITNGLLAIPSNYHAGNLISSATPALVLEIPNVDGMKQLRVWFSRNKSYKIDFPIEVSLATTDGTILETVVPEKLKEHTGHSMVEFNIPPTLRGPLVLTITRNPDVKTMAVEEIEAFR